jgi:hypothetical protein
VVLVTEKVEEKITDVSRLAREVLEQIKDGSPIIVERDDLAVDDSSLREAA